MLIIKKSPIKKVRNWGWCLLGTVSLDTGLRSFEMEYKKIQARDYYEGGWGEGGGNALTVGKFYSLVLCWKITF